VRLSDGRTITVNTDDPEVAVRTAERWQYENPAPRGYREAYERRTSEHSSRAPRDGKAHSSEVPEEVSARRSSRCASHIFCLSSLRSVSALIMSSTAVRSN
jgi:hypothetical protein